MELPAIGGLPDDGGANRLQQKPEPLRPMTSLASELSGLVGQAFAAEGFSETFGQVQESDRPDLAPFQCNGALAAAKASKASPRAIAEKIAARLKRENIFSRVEIAGPGFLNLDLGDGVLN